MEINSFSDLNRLSLQVKKVHVEAWGCDCYVKEFTGRDRDQVDDLIQASDKALRALLLHLGWTNNAGTRLFDTAADVPLDAYSDKGFEELTGYILEFNGMKKKQSPSVNETFSGTDSPSESDAQSENSKGGYRQGNTPIGYNTGPKSSPSQISAGST